MTESEFIAMTDRVLEQVGEALDDSDSDVDWQLNDGVLEIDCSDAVADSVGGGSGGKIILNRHLPNRELWLATKGGGYHFRNVDGRWVDTRGKNDLGAELAGALATQAGMTTPPAFLFLRETD